MTHEEIELIKFLSAVVAIVLIMIVGFKYLRGE